MTEAPATAAMTAESIKAELEAQLLPRVPEFYYDTGKKEFLVKQSRGGTAREWIAQTEKQMKTRMAFHGLRVEKYKGESLSPVDIILLEASDDSDRSVRTSGPLAGHREGIYHLGGLRMLVTSSPRIIKPEEGDWGTIRHLMEGLFGENGGVQMDYLHAYNKLTVVALRTGNTRGMPAQAFCGPRDCGKTFYQNHILTPIFGGRSANPYAYMTGKTPFNDDLFGAEHLMMGDEVADTDLKSRLRVGGFLKQMVANEDQRRHAKFCDGFTVRALWRMSLSLNDGIDSMLVLPPLDADLWDKLSLFRARRFEFPMPIVTQEDKDTYAARIASELPAYLHWLDQWDIPTHVLGRRWTVAAYHHPELIACLNELSPEFVMAELICTCWATPVPTPGDSPAIAAMMEARAGEPLVLTAAEIERGLTSPDSPVNWKARQLLVGGSKKVMAYLGRLADKHPENIVRVRNKRGERAWKLLRLGDVINAARGEGSEHE